MGEEMASDAACCKPQPPTPTRCFPFQSIHNDVMKHEFPLHDASFDGIVLSGKSCALYFTCTDGTGCEVNLTDVEALQMDDFVNGNIVVFFGTMSGEAPEKHIALERLFAPPHPSASEEFHARYRNHVASKVAAIQSGDLTLVEMEPAIGATMLATCKSIAFTQHGATT